MKTNTKLDEFTLGDKIAVVTKSGVIYEGTIQDGTPINHLNTGSWHSGRKVIIGSATIHIGAETHPQDFRFTIDLSQVEAIGIPDSTTEQVR